MIQAYGKKVLGLVAGLSLSMLASAADIVEIPANIVKVDLPASSVTLFDLGMGQAKYAFAFDLKIKLLNGDAGTANNLRSGDGVTAIVDNDNQLVHAIYVVSEGG